VYSVAGAGGDTGWEKVVLGCRQPQPDRKKLLDQFSECSKRANACGLSRLAAATAALAFFGRPLHWFDGSSAKGIDLVYMGGDV
jgi:hypothetical protein